MTMKSVSKPAANAGSKPAARTNGQRTEPVLSLSIPTLPGIREGRPFRLPVWEQLTQSRASASLDRLTGNTGPLIDHLQSVAGSDDDGELRPDCLLAFCRDVLAQQAFEQTGSRRFRLRIPVELVIDYDEPGTKQEPQEQKAVPGLTFG